jgi:hypothetical protein
MGKPLQFHPSKLIRVPFKKMEGAQRVESENAIDFWKSKDASAYKDKKGVYVFVIQTQNTYIPWYVGQASKSFQQEVFTDDKLEKYNSALAEYKQNFKPHLQFLVPEKKKGAPNQRALDELEKTLTLWGKERNPSIKNTQNTREVQRFAIAGITTPDKGAPKKEARLLKEIMGL